MASKPVANLSAPEKEQLAVSYAAFVLSAQGADVTADSINSVLKAANINASQALVKAFAKTLGNKNVSEFFGAVGSEAGPASTAPAAEENKKGEEKKDTKKNAPPPPPPPPVEEEEMDMGGLFDWPKFNLSHNSNNEIITYDIALSILFPSFY